MNNKSLDSGIAGPYIEALAWEGIGLPPVLFSPLSFFLQKLASLYLYTNTSTPSSYLVAAVRHAKTNSRSIRVQSKRYLNYPKLDFSEIYDKVGIEDQQEVDNATE